MISPSDGLMMLNVWEIKRTRLFVTWKNGLAPNVCVTGPSKLMIFFLIIQATMIPGRKQVRDIYITKTMRRCSL